MGVTRARLLADAGFVLALVEAGLAVAFGWASELSSQQLMEGFVVSNTIIGLSLSVAGYPIARARPGNRVGWLLLAGGVSFQLSGTGYAVLAWGTDPGDTGVGWRLLATFANGAWPLAVTVFVPLALALFPDGRSVAPFGRYVCGAVVAAGSVFTLGILTAEDSTVSGLGIDGYLQWPWLSEQVWLTVIAGVVWYIAIALVLVGLVLRYRRGGDRERRQVLWLLFAAVLMVALFLVSDLLGVDSWANIFVIALVPMAILVAVLRYQLLDIRLVVSRSLVYAALTGLTVLTYVTVVALTERTLSQRAPLGPPVLAAIVAALAFNPVRLRLQAGVDWLLYGARNDPVRAVAEVGAQLGDATGLDGVLRRMCEVMRLPGAAVTSGGTELARYGRLDATTTFTLPEEGELVVALRSGESRLSAADQRVLALLTGPLAMAVRLRAARNAVVAAREEERRRLRRDLHDGIGPALTGVILQADAARRIVDSDPAEAARLMDALRRRTTETVDEIRRLVNELRPPELDVLGLSGAIREHAATLRARTDGSPLVVTVDTEPLPQLPAGIEVAVYRITIEALHNVTRHSGASAAMVSLRVAGPDLRLDVRDDGRATNGSWRPGVGLTSMKERVAELSGTFVAGPDGAGGHVGVTVPIGSTP
jgi:signal transduction histidine kinase